MHSHSPRLNGRCIVCGAFSTSFFAGVKDRDHQRCSACQATFLDPAQRVPPDEEYARYCQHRNHPEDKRYRRFLSKLSDPLLKRLPPSADGLDYGCGPGPVLACMLREAGHRMRLFDPFFYPDPKTLDGCYDFITCTETIEHFHRPAEEFTRFDTMLRPGGWLAVMTCFLSDDVHFASWHYRRDPTHAIFYREATMAHIARRFGWTCEIPVKDVALMQKPLHTESMYESIRHRKNLREDVTKRIESGRTGALRPPSSHTTVRTVPYTAVPAVRRFGDFLACRPTSAQPYLADSVRDLRLPGPLSERLLGTHRESVSRFLTGSALGRLVRPARTTSADFCPLIPTPLSVGSRIGKRTDLPGYCAPTFPPYTRRIYSRPFRMTIGL